MILKNLMRSRWGSCGRMGSEGILIVRISNFLVLTAKYHKPIKRDIYKEDIISGKVYYC